MPGSWDLFDGIDLTADSESSPRTRAIDTLQIHHGTIISYSGLRSMMDPGGRLVSANGAMANDGTLYEVVSTPTRRAFTSSSSFDNQCLTVEACNTTLGPEWGISAATRTRFARLAVGMYRLGLLKHLGRGVGGIIGHYEVPGTYATACPGPDMHLDAIAAEAQALYAAGDTGLASGGAPKPIITAKADDMFLYRQTQGQLTTWILYVPALGTYQTTQDSNQAARWGELVGHEAWLLSDPAVAELLNVVGIFQP